MRTLTHPSVYAKIAIQHPTPAHGVPQVVIAFDLHMQWISKNLDKGNLVAVYRSQFSPSLAGEISAITLELKMAYDARFQDGFQQAPWPNQLCNFE